jgi:transcriptional regulator with XRE-family HTH domain
VTRRSATLAVRFVPERGSTLADLLWELLERSPSQRDLADKLELAPATISRLLHETSTPQEKTLEKIAEYTGLPVTDVRRMAGRAEGDSAQFTLSEEANQLNLRERALVCELIRVLLEAHGPRVTRGRPQL